MIWWGMHMPGHTRKARSHEMNAAIIDRLRASRPDLEVAYELAIDNADRMRAVLRRAYPKLGAGYTDLYKAFAWRNWRLARQDGTAGIVSAPQRATVQRDRAMAQDRTQRRHLPKRCHPAEYRRLGL